jgi:recombination protein RecT
MAQGVPVSRIERARKASRAKTGPWVTDEDAMWRKTAVRAVRPWLPLSPQAGEALAHDGATVSGLQVVEETAQPVLTEAPE